MFLIMIENSEIRTAVFKWEDYFYKKYRKQRETASVQRYFNEMSVIEDNFFEWGEVFKNKDVFYFPTNI